MAQVKLETHPFDVSNLNPRVLSVGAKDEEEEDEEEKEEADVLAA